MIKSVRNKWIYGVFGEDVAGLPADSLGDLGGVRESAHSGVLEFVRRPVQVGGVVVVRVVRNLPESKGGGQKKWNFNQESKYIFSKKKVYKYKIQ